MNNINQILQVQQVEKKYQSWIGSCFCWNWKLPPIHFSINPSGQIHDGPQRRPSKSRPYKRASRRARRNSLPGGKASGVVFCVSKLWKIGPQRKKNTKMGDPKLLKVITKVGSLTISLCIFHLFFYSKSFGKKKKKTRHSLKWWIHGQIKHHRKSRRSIECKSVSFT